MFGASFVFGLFLASSILDQSDPCEVRYSQYSMYPSFHSQWPGGTFVIDLESGRLNMNDVSTRFEIVEDSGWRVIKAKVSEWVWAVPISPGGPDSLQHGDFFFTLSSTTKTLHILGIALDVHEVSLYEGDVERGRALFNYEDGIVAFIYWTDGEVGLADWFFHGTGYPLFSRSSLECKT